MYRKVSTEFYIYENVGEKSASKSYHPVRLLSVPGSLPSAPYWKSKKQRKKRKNERNTETAFPEVIVNTNTKKPLTQIKSGGRLIIS